MMNQEAMYRYFGVTAEQVEQWSEEAENGEFRGEPGTLIQQHPVTAQERAAIDRAHEYHRRQDAQAIGNGRKLTTASR
ncbi:hypothetical protein PT282_01155 [Bifidobacterium sp. ESL0763]|uniref:hypothetical protein n=1 Tax=Bifidobacterium sp. ESL0763 TaxID=2983227 RepID=UPI0023F8001A|nr:hypothetical protein [Bifidobacterium sp. ESL0763]MDF7663290.1 hypothetical protein [Bifidobacterium sp. ESL0763]